MRVKVKHLIFHSLIGRRTNDALSRAFAYVLMKKIGRSIGVAISDNGFILTIPFETFDSRSWLSLKKLKRKLTRVEPREIAFLVDSNNFEEILKKAIANTELIKRKFRHCAARAFMILRNYKGYEISVEKQQMNAERLIRVVKKLEGFPILEETYREILEDFMDVENAKKILKAEPTYVEVKAAMNVGFFRKRLSLASMPRHEDIVTFANELVKHLPGYRIIGEYLPSRVVLISRLSKPIKIINA